MPSTIEKHNLLARATRGAFLAVMFVLTLAPLDFVSARIFGAPFHYVFISVAMTSLAAAAYRLDSKLDDFDLWLFAVIAGFSISLIASARDAAAARTLAGFIVKGPAAAFIAKRLFAGRLEKASSAALIAATAMAAIGLAEFFFQWNPFFRMKELFFDYWRLNFSLTPRSGMAGTVGHPVPFAACLALALPAAAHMAVSSKNIVRAAPLVLIAAGIVFSFSRGSWIAAGAACVLFAFWAGRRLDFRRLLPVALAIGAAAVITATRTENMDVGRFSRAGIKQDILSSHRAASYKTTYNVLKKNPLFGVGFGNYPKAHSVFRAEGADPSLETPDNVYLRFLCETGIVGTFVFAAFALYWFIRIFRAAAVGGGDIILRATLAGLTGFMINNMTADLFYWTAPQFLFWFLLGAAVGGTRNSVTGQSLII